ncbi:MAG TPA: site-2 protease family protein [Phycisphaerales bacterium]|nr:site-2 protease family protein [Phycisphaerales bacterium]
MMGSGWWFAEYWNVLPMLAVGWAFWVITSVCLHELAHGVAAIRLGDDTPIYTGHMTWNPVVHMGKMSLIMFALVGITWGAMPVNPSNFRHRYGDAIVAFAGPLSNLLIFLVLMPILIGWTRYAAGNVDPVLFKNMHVFLNAGCAINLILFMFNLLPVPPLDGSRIVGDFFPRFNELWRGPNREIVAIGAFVLVFFVVGRHVASFAFRVNMAVLDQGVTLLGG